MGRQSTPIGKTPFINQSELMIELSLAESWEEVSCLLCGPGSKTEVFWRDIEGGDILCCSRCGLAYRSPRRPEEYLTRYFEEEWTEHLALEKPRTYILRRIAKWILERHPLPRTILDIGSGSGNLLTQFPETWNRFGVEPSKTACQIAKRILPEANIINSSFLEANLPKEFFDVITIVGTIYYLPQPLRDLARIRDLLKPEGVALVESPNFANRGYVYRWLNHKFYETQVYFYTPITVGKILNKIGMQVVDRIDLPGHRITSGRLSGRVISVIEFVITRIMRKISLGIIDLVPRFVLVAKPKLKA